MSLLRTASRAAVASSVHGKVQRRQQARWAQADQAAAAAAAPQLAPLAPVGLAQVAPVAPVAPLAPVGLAPVAPAPVAAPAPAPTLDAIPDIERRIALLRQLADLHSSGILTPEEFAAQKARVLG